MKYAGKTVNNRDMVAKEYVDGSISLLDSGVVHKAGDETVSGQKTFTGGIKATLSESKGAGDLAVTTTAASSGTLKYRGIAETIGASDTSSLVTDGAVISYGVKPVTSGSNDVFPLLACPNGSNPSANGNPVYTESVRIRPGIGQIGARGIYVTRHPDSGPQVNCYAMSRYKDGETWGSGNYDGIYMYLESPYVSQNVRHPIYHWMGQTFENGQSVSTMNDVILRGIYTPQQNTDAANKKYVDDAVSSGGGIPVTAIVTELTPSCTDSQVPSAKCVYDVLGDIESILDNIIG